MNASVATAPACTKQTAKQNITDRPVLVSASFSASAGVIRCSGGWGPTGLASEKGEADVMPARPGGACTSPRTSAALTSWLVHTRRTNSKLERFSQKRRRSAMMRFMAAPCVPNLQHRPVTEAQTADGSVLGPTLSRLYRWVFSAAF
jgi:hypothetical protein